VPEFPLGLLYIGTKLRDSGIDCIVIDMSFYGLNIENLKSIVNQYSPDIVGITVMTYTFCTALEISHMVKCVDPGIYVILGGPHATFQGREILSESQDVDIVVRYEGEITMVELLKCLEHNGTLRRVKGIAFRENELIFETPDRPFIENLDELPFPDRNFLPLQKYKEILGYCSMITSRGCPYLCRFCSNVFGKNYRARSVENIIDEIEIIVSEYGFTNVSFVDDLFTLDTKRVIEICAEIKNHGLEFEWGCSARVDTVTKDLLKTMKHAGLTGIFVGFESGVQRTLDLMKKGNTVEQGIKVAKWTKELGIELVASFIIGFPGETKHMALSTIDYARKLHPSKVLFNFFVPLPGSVVYDKKEEYGITFRYDYTQLNKAKGNIPIIETREMNIEDSVNVYLTAAKEFDTTYINRKEVVKNE
jgi:radical SAM superfamily enzyme YgiQ (UPF0313 family)